MRQTTSLLKKRAASSYDAVTKMSKVQNPSKTTDQPVDEKSGAQTHVPKMRAARPALMTVASLTVTTSLGKALIQNLSLSVQPGDKIAVIGAEGSGKSTLVEYLAGMMREGFQYGGSVSSVGTSGYLPQEVADEWRNHDVVEFLFKQHAGEEFDLERWNSYGDAAASLAALGLEEGFIHRKVGTLSGGEKVRVALAKLLLKNPTYLLLDEPTRNLSPLTAPVLREELRSFPGAILVVSHDRYFIQEVCDRVLQLTPKGLTPIELSELVGESN